MTGVCRCPFDSLQKMTTFVFSVAAAADQIMDRILYSDAA